jgi:hypothetical protein
MHRIFCLLTFETFVLVAALFLLAYTKKSELSKWLQYVAATIAVFITVLMVGTVFTCCRPCYQPMTGWNYHSPANSCLRGPMSNDCCMRNNSCSMGGMGGNCCMGGPGNMQFEKEIRIELDDEEMQGDSIKKKVIIKKTK